MTLAQARRRIYRLAAQLLDECRDHAILYEDDAGRMLSDEDVATMKATLRSITQQLYREMSRAARACDPIPETVLEVAHDAICRRARVLDGTEPEMAEALRGLVIRMDGEEAK